MQKICSYFADAQSVSTSIYNIANTSEDASQWANNTVKEIVYRAKNSAIAISDCLKESAKKLVEDLLEASDDLADESLHTAQFLKCACNILWGVTIHTSWSKLLTVGRSWSRSCFTIVMMFRNKLPTALTIGLNGLPAAWAETVFA